MNITHQNYHETINKDGQAHRRSWRLCSVVKSQNGFGAGKDRSEGRRRRDEGTRQEQPEQTLSLAMRKVMQKSLQLMSK